MALLAKTDTVFLKWTMSGLAAPATDNLVLDVDSRLVDGQPADVDLETGSAFTACLAADPLLRFFDVNGMTFSHDGEDTIQGCNANGIFDQRGAAAWGGSGPSLCCAQEYWDCA